MGVWGWGMARWGGGGWGKEKEGKRGHCCCYTSPQQTSMKTLAQVSIEAVYVVIYG